MVTQTSEKNFRFSQSLPILEFMVGLDWLEPKRACPSRFFSIYTSEMSHDYFKPKKKKIASGTFKKMNLITTTKY